MNRFDQAPDRIGSGCLKWDTVPSTDIIPMWVADMDFATAPIIIEALKRRVDHGVFGYTHADRTYYEALQHWFKQRHDYLIDPSMVILTPGVVPALSAVIKALAPAGSGIIVQTPAYNCFFSSIRNNGCEIVDNPLRRMDINKGLFTFEIDFDDLEAKAAMPSTRLMLLCNPHNPAGRIWSRNELERVADICRRNGVTVVSDEIHCELTCPGNNYTPYATVDHDAVVCLSPSKAFNTAGLQIANIVCPSQEIRDRVDRAVNINEVCDVNPFGIEALKAAYSGEGAQWLDDLRDYLWENYQTMAAMLREHLPECPVTKLEATYLPIIDVTTFTDDSEQLACSLMEKARVWVNPGEMYGCGGYLRVNIACPRQRLVEGITRLTGYLRQLK